MKLLPNKASNISVILVIQLAVLIFLSIGIIYKINQVQRQLINQTITTQDSLDDFVGSIDIANSPSKGSESASVTLVEYSDFGCTYCGKSRTIIDRIQNRYQGQVNVVYKFFPRGGESSPYFVHSLAATCAHQQDKFWEVHDFFFDNQEDLLNINVTDLADTLDLDKDKYQKCLNSDKAKQALLQDLEEGASYGVSATPTFFVNGHRIVGALPINIFYNKIEQTLQDSETSTPYSKF